MMPDFRFEDECFGLPAGVDEAGRGPWIGPVVAGAVIFLNKNIHPFLAQYLNDSKKISAQRRAQLYDVIQKESECRNLCYGIGEASAIEIDNLNILQASFLAMRRAVENLKIKPDIALIDGNRTPKDFVCKTKCIIKGDSLSYSIAAASIVAKVYRDGLMQKMALLYPGYGLEKNAGYGTKEHIEGIQKFGITPEHRMSYKPIKDYIAKKSAKK